MKIKTGSGLEVPNLNETLKKLVSIYINIQNGLLDIENIKDVLNKIKTLNLSASLKSDKYIYWDNLD